MPQSRASSRLRKNSLGVSFRGAAGDEESRIVLKTLRARFLASLGMTQFYNPKSKMPQSRASSRLRKNSLGVSFRGAAGDEESRIVLKTLRARFLASLGMTQFYNPKSKMPQSRASSRLRKNSLGVSFRGAAGDEESRIVLKTLRARFLASLGMTTLTKVFQHSASRQPPANPKSKIQNLKCSTWRLPFSSPPGPS